MWVSDRAEVTIQTAGRVRCSLSAGTPRADPTHPAAAGAPQGAGVGVAPDFSPELLDVVAADEVLVEGEHGLLLKIHRCIGGFTYEDEVTLVSGLAIGEGV